MRPKPLTVAEVEYVAFSLAQELMTWDEPIPDFGTRFPNVLESCLEQPFIKFSRKDLYRGLIGKTSILFYLLIKNHPFENGNKRIAVMSLLYFLHKNEKWLNVDAIGLHNIAKFIAASKPRDRESIVLATQDFLRKHLISRRT